MIAAAVLGGTSLFGGIGRRFGAVVGATLIQTVQSGLVFTGVNLYLQPMVMAGIIFLAVLIDAVRTDDWPGWRSACFGQTIKPANRSRNCIARGVGCYDGGTAKGVPPPCPD